MPKGEYSRVEKDLKEYVKKRDRTNKKTSRFEESLTGFGQSPDTGRRAEIRENQAKFEKKHSKSFKDAKDKLKKKRSFEDNDYGK